MKKAVVFSEVEMDDSGLIASATASAAKHLVVVQNKADNKHTHIKLVPFDEIKMGTQHQYIIRHIIPRVGLSVVCRGPPEVRKIILGSLMWSCT